MRQDLALILCALLLTTLLQPSDLSSGTAVAHAATAFALAHTPQELHIATPDAHVDQSWVAGFESSGVDGSVNALAAGEDGTLFVGGEFVTAGNIRANSVAIWDEMTATWRPLGSGLSGGRHIPGARVFALSLGLDGSLFAGGDFDTAGGLTANSIARWDRTTSSWHPLGIGMSGGSYPEPPIAAMTIGPDSMLYVGGEFTTAGGVATQNVARWDGTSWHPLGSGVSGGWDPHVTALALSSDGSLYAGGDFTIASGTMANFIARWDGVSWHNLGSGMNGEVEALAFGPDGSLYAAGTFTTAGGNIANHIARWDQDTSSWHPLGNGANGGIHTLAFGHDGSLYAGGYFSQVGNTTAKNIARWDGQSWHPVSGGLNERVLALAMGQNRTLYAGGRFTIAGEAAATYVARWNSTAPVWQSLSQGYGISGSINAVVLGPDDSVYAGGAFDTAGSTLARSIARWDGSSWHPVGTGIDGSVHALVVGSDGSLYAGGDFITAGGVTANHIARWDGTLWHPLGSGMDRNVNALAIGPDGSLYAGGAFTASGGVSLNHVARWDGSSWHPLDSGLDGGVVDLATGPNGLLYAGGVFTTAGGMPASHVARWDGSSWYALGSGANSDVLALVVGPDGSLYAGGGFTAIGGIPANHIARWDGLLWHPLGIGTNYGVFALTTAPGNSLYAGGNFNSAGGHVANRIARWDTSASLWSSLGSGIGYSFAAGVWSLASEPNGSLFVGGHFVEAGGMPSVNIAHWVKAVEHQILLPFVIHAN